jgi:hypothetical protein
LKVTTVSLCPENFPFYSYVDQINFVNTDPDKFLHCFCDQYSFVDQKFDQADECSDYLDQKISAQLLTYFSSFIVLIVNYLIDYILNSTTSYEMHHSEDNLNRSLFLRLFFLRYINTSCIFIVNTNIPGWENRGGSRIGEFSSDWYQTIGVTILLVQVNEAV